MVGVAAMRTNDELIEEELRTDAAFRAEWEHAALGRAVASQSFVTAPTTTFRSTISLSVSR
jgi:hypothetical protein